MILQGQLPFSSLIFHLGKVHNQLLRCITMTNLSDATLIAQQLRDTIEEATRREEEKTKILLEMMKKGKVNLNVGGQTFVCNVSTLASDYFHRLLRNSLKDEVLFIGKNYCFFKFKTGNLSTFQ